MSRHHQKRIRPLTGHFLGWGDDLKQHRHIKLATVDGEQLVKVAKSLRPHIQDWQPGICLTLLAQESIGRDTSVRKIKVKQLLDLPKIDPDGQLPPTLAACPSIDSPPVANQKLGLTKIQVCQGSSCRRRGSDKICRSMQAYLNEHSLTDRVQIETVKCLHQCKAAPHAIVTSPAEEMLSGKTHYRQIQPSQIPVLLAKHFPTALPSKPTASSLIAKIAAYLQRHQISTATTTL